MKKLIVFALVLACLLCFVGCGKLTYKLPHDQFCYSVESNQPYELSYEDKQYIIDILNSATWINGMTNCYSEIVFYTQEQEVRYSSCGVFSDYTNKVFVTVSDEQRDTLNEMLNINRYKTD